MNVMQRKKPVLQREGGDGKGGGKFVDNEVLQGVCKGQEAEKDAGILGQNEVAS